MGRFSTATYFNDQPVQSASTTRTSQWYALRAAEVFITIAVLLAGYVFYQAYWSNIKADSAQADVSEQLQHQWSQAANGDSAPAVDPNNVGEGEPVAQMYIPSFGNDWSYTVVSGTTLPSLVKGPGFYRGSQNFGDTGNSAIAGHRDGTGAPFYDLDKLHTCDAVVVETSESWLVYRVLPTGAVSDKVGKMRECVRDYRTASQLAQREYRDVQGQEIITPDVVDTVAPVPYHPEISPDRAHMSMLTLTTCHPHWENGQRLVIHAMLAEEIDKSSVEAGLKPDVLSEGVEDV